MDNIIDGDYPKVDHHWPSCLEAQQESACSPYYTLSIPYANDIDMQMPLHCYCPQNDAEMQEHDDTVLTYIMGGEL